MLNSPPPYDRRSVYLGLVFLALGLAGLILELIDHHTWEPKHSVLPVALALLGAGMIDPVSLRVALRPFWRAWGRRGRR